MLVGPLFRYLAMSLVSGNFFMRLGLAVLRKHLTDDYRQMFSQDGFILCVWQGPACLPGVTSF